MFGLAHHSTTMCLLLTELMLGNRRGRRPGLPRGAEHPRGRMCYLLKASCSRVPIPDSGRAGQGSSLGDTWPQMWAPLCSASGPWHSFPSVLDGSVSVPRRF